MALQLQTSMETLEQPVQERTAEYANHKLEQLVNLDGLTQVANCREQRDLVRILHLRQEAGGRRCIMMQFLPTSYSKLLAP